MRSGRWGPELTIVGLTIEKRQFRVEVPDAAPDEVIKELTRTAPEEGAAGGLIHGENSACGGGVSVM